MADLFQNVLRPCFHCGGKGNFVIKKMHHDRLVELVTWVHAECTKCTFKTSPYYVSNHRMEKEDIRDEARRRWDMGIPQFVVKGKKESGEAVYCDWKELVSLPCDNAPNHRHPSDRRVPILRTGKPLYQVHYLVERHTEKNRKTGAFQFIYMRELRDFEKIA